MSGLGTLPDLSCLTHSFTSTIVIGGDGGGCEAETFGQGIGGGGDDEGEVHLPAEGASARCIKLFSLEGF